MDDKPTDRRTFLFGSLLGGLTLLISGEDALAAHRR